MLYTSDKTIDLSAVKISKWIKEDDDDDEEEEEEEVGEKKTTNKQHI